TSELRSNIQSGGYELQVEFSGIISRSSLLKIKGVAEAKEDGKNMWLISTNTSEDIRKDLAEMALQQQIAVLSMSKKEQRLEDIFKELTGAKASAPIEG
ncbi:MAG: DUF4162 domain-containing protein, partial [Flavobacteriales bacterium]